MVHWRWFPYGQWRCFVAEDYSDGGDYGSGKYQQYHNWSEKLMFLSAAKGAGRNTRVNRQTTVATGFMTLMAPKLPLAVLFSATGFKSIGFISPDWRYARHSPPFMAALFTHTCRIGGAGWHFLTTVFAVSISTRFIWFLKLALMFSQQMAFTRYANDLSTRIALSRRIFNGHYLT